MGHDVPKDKSESRYYNSLKQVLEASRLCNRAYFFDSSRKTYTRLLAEMEEGKKLKIHEDYLNQWFADYILKPFRNLNRSVQVKTVLKSSDLKGEEAYYEF